MELLLEKIGGHYLAPADQQAFEQIEKLPAFQGVRVTVTKTRNIKFHKKFFALLNFAYEYWEPAEISDKHGTPEKNFDQFREDLTILAGYYVRHFRVDGSVRVKAKSISFAKMEPEDFEKLYNSVLTVIIQRILPSMTAPEIEKLAAENQAMAFA